MRVLDPMTFITNDKVRSRVDKEAADLCQQSPLSPLLLIISLGLLPPWLLVSQLSVEFITHHQNPARSAPFGDDPSSLGQVLVGVIESVDWKCSTFKCSSIFMKIRISLK